MSESLGSIHFGLYNKIIYIEKLQDAIFKDLESRDVNTQDIKEEVYNKYGKPIKGALEDHIDESNIHDWLQQEIKKSETRFAESITVLLAENRLQKERLYGICNEEGKKAGEKVKSTLATPKAIFDEIFNYLIEGMPCDRVHEVKEESDQKVVWDTLMCMHKPYWEEAKGDVSIYHEMKNAWISGFVSQIEPGYQYSVEGSSHIIAKK